MASLIHSLIESTSNLFALLAARDLAAIGFALLLIHLARHAGMWIFAIVVLPGTALHELAHFTVALLLGAQPTFPSLIPARTDRGWRLGEVRFRPGHLRAMFIAIAPLLLAPLALWWALTFVTGASWPWYALHVWIAAALLHACLPSKTDWRLAFPALAVLAVLAALIAWYYLSA